MCVLLTKYTVLSHASLLRLSFFSACLPPQNLKGQVLSSIVFNACDLMRIDLDGVQVLLPQLLKALELILSELTPRFK